MPQHSRFAELHREELKRLAATGALAVVPLGATEQHGPHLATGTDWFTVDALAHEAARLASHDGLSVVVAPALPFGSSDHHLIFGGTVSLRTETYLQVLKDVLRSLAADGFERAFLLNGHGGNQELAELAVRDAALEFPLQATAASYWTIAWDALVAAGAHHRRNLPGHAGDFETSMMLGLKPELTPGPLPHRDTPADGDPRPRQRWRAERHGFWQSIDGYTDSPDQADAARGQEHFAIIAREVARAFLTVGR